MLLPRFQDEFTGKERYDRRFPILFPPILRQFVNYVDRVYARLALFGFDLDLLGFEGNVASYIDITSICGIVIITRFQLIVKILIAIKMIVYTEHIFE